MFLANKTEHVNSKGEESSDVKVITHAPGECYRAFLFTLCTNDLVDNIGSSMRFFAGAAVVYREGTKLSNSSEMQDVQHIDAE